MNKLGKLLKDYVDNQLKDAKKDYNKVINELNNELYKEMIDMYDTFIDQFYSYKTTSYIRHGQTKPGTQTGVSLYRAQNISIGGNYYNPKLIVDFRPSDMNVSYEWDEAPDVFNYVMYGIRFPYFNNSSNWIGKYEGKYFSFKGTPMHAFQLFNDTFDEIAEKGFREKWAKTKWGH